MNNKKIKIYACIMTVCTLVLSFSMVATATTTSRKANLKSYGTIQMEKQDGTVKGVIAAADMEYLADEIDNLENTYKCKTLEGLNGINTYFKADGSVTHNAAESAITTSTANLLTFEQLNNAIKSSQASANAPVASEIVSGKSVWANGNNITGTMPNNGATGKSNLTAGSSYTIPSGFTTGGTVTAASLSSQTQGTATAANLSQGVTAWVNGTKITGTGEDNNSYYDRGKADASSIQELYPLYYGYGKYTYTFSENYEKVLVFHGGFKIDVPDDHSYIQYFSYTGNGTVNMIIDHGNGYEDGGADKYINQACRVGIITNVKRGDTIYFHAYPYFDGVSAILAINS